MKNKFKYIYLIVFLLVTMMLLFNTNNVFAAKKYTVKFYNYNGTSEYKNLRTQIYQNSYISLPSVPSNDNWQSLDWVTKPSGNIKKKVGTKIKVTGNINFYGRRSKIYTIYLKNNNGSLYKKYSIPINKTLYFPSIDTKNNNMFLGWSKAKNKINNPEYESGSKIPKKTASYYMVVFPISKDIKPSSIFKPSTYKTVYFIGDSRTVAIDDALGSKQPKNVVFISKGGMGYTWLKNTAYPKLLQYVKKNSKYKKAVVIGFGANDIQNINYYISFYNTIGTTLKKYNCDLYLTPINPVNSAVIKNHFGSIKKYRTETNVKKFNSQLYNKVCKKNNNFTYINTYNYLLKTGWISYRQYTSVRDGLHYSANTSLKIYNYVIKYLNNK